MAGDRTLHQVEIPIDKPGVPVHYRVRTGQQVSTSATFVGVPTDELRVAVVANWHHERNLAALLQDRPALLVTAGDNIPALWPVCGEGVTDCTAPYAKLIDAYPELFRTTPFMPALGNHDREMRKRGDKPPAEPVYDVDATAFRAFFALPDAEWRWHFDWPQFQVRLIALDLHHTQDFGTTWQTGHAFDRDSEQIHWYQSLQAQRPEGYVITLYNERHGQVRGRGDQGLHPLFKQGEACISGFGHFGERAMFDGLPYFNTSLNGQGAKYPDAHSQAFVHEHNYLLLTRKPQAATLTVEIKNLAGEVRDRAELAPRGKGS